MGQVSREDSYLSEALMEKKLSRPFDNITSFQETETDCSRLLDGLRLHDLEHFVGLVIEAYSKTLRVCSSGVVVGLGVENKVEGIIFLLQTVAMPSNL